MQKIRARIVLCLAIVIGGAGAALAQEACIEPVRPARLDSSASADRMRAALAQARQFIAQSSLYQDCLLREVEAAKTQAAAEGMPFEPMIETSARLKIANSRKAQDQAGAAVNGAVTASKLPPN
jgi:hypothetical protein